VPASEPSRAVAQLGAGEVPVLQPVEDRSVHEPEPGACGGAELRRGRLARAESLAGSCEVASRMPSMSLLTSGMPAALSVIFRDAVPFWSIQARNASRLAASASKGGSDEEVLLTREVVMRSALEMPASRAICAIESD